MEKDCLYMRTLGGFSLQWKDKQIAGNKESQFACLMQYLLHSGSEGVSRDRMEEILFEDREIADLHHTMQSVVYNTKKKLRSAGLPDVNYIILKKGIFYWTPEIPVVEDAAEFERMCQAADEAKTPDEQMAKYLEACQMYVGEFLPSQAGVIWAAQEARRYRALFCGCVERLLPILRDHQDYLLMEKLGMYASRVQPLADWEAVTMEALVAQGRHEDARRLYENTVDYYSEEQGLRPSRKMLELLNRMGSQLEHQYATLDEIQEELTDQEPPMGGYFCPYPVFQEIYRMVERMIERGGQSVYLMLCTIVDTKGNPMRESPMLEQLSARLQEAICASIRHSDTVTRYGKGQYLVLLVNTTREDCNRIQSRINRRFIIGRQRTGIRYYVNSVISVEERHWSVEKVSWQES